VWVAVLDTGLVDTWRQYFPEQRIAEEYARCFQGGGNDQGEVSEPPNCWEHDTNSHGTHVTSTILGYSFGGTPVNGVAPRATVIPVKVLKNAGFGWSSQVARGIVYVADLKAGPLSGSPVVINMSLGGPQLDAVEQAAIDYANEQGVIVVAAAGNEGDDGMSFRGAHGAEEHLAPLRGRGGHPGGHGGSAAARMPHGRAAVGSAPGVLLGRRRDRPRASPPRDAALAATP
jgi:subtilisin family serine protease